MTAAIDDGVSRPAPGAPVRVEMTKWGERPHWEYDATYLGSDDHGDWLAIPAGTPMARPGMSFLADVDQVSLVPRSAWWVATFHAPGIWTTCYVDMSTVPTWDGTVLRAVDLDLDVIRRADDSVFVDDEDEFAEHRVAYGYPPEVVAGAEASCAWVLDVARRRQPPFDGSHVPWLAQVAVLRAPRPRT